jgi:hypothetical protein
LFLDLHMPRPVMHASCARPPSSEKRAPIGQLPCPVHDKIYYAAWPSREWELHTLPDVPCTVGSRARIPVVPIIMVLH